MNLDMHFFNNTISPYRYFYIFILQMFWGQTSSMQTFHICLWECKLVLLASSCVNRAEKCVGGVLTIRAICHFFALWRGRSLFWISGRTLFVSSYSKTLRPYIWCHKIIMNVIFKSICWLQQRIRDTLCSWIQLRCLISVCECVCVGVLKLAANPSVWHETGTTAQYVSHTERQTLTLSVTTQSSYPFQMGFLH